MKKLLVFISIIFLCLVAFAERPLITNYNEFAAKAKTELDSSMKSGVLFEFGVKHAIKGEYIMDITVHEKGKVLTVFAVSNDSDNLSMQNKLKDFVRTIEFSFKLPKGKPYKIQYTFHFN